MVLIAVVMPRPGFFKRGHHEDRHGTVSWEEYQNLEIKLCELREEFDDTTERFQLSRVATRTLEDSFKEEQAKATQLHAVLTSNEEQIAEFEQQLEAAGKFAQTVDTLRRELHIAREEREQQCTEQGGHFVALHGELRELRSELEQQVQLQDRFRSEVGDLRNQEERLQNEHRGQLEAHCAKAERDREIASTRAAAERRELAVSVTKLEVRAAAMKTELQTEADAATSASRTNSLLVNELREASVQHAAQEEMGSLDLATSGPPSEVTKLPDTEFLSINDVSQQRIQEVEATVHELRSELQAASIGQGCDVDSCLKSLKSEVLESTALKEELEAQLEERTTENAMLTALLQQTHADVGKQLDSGEDDCEKVVASSDTCAACKSCPQEVCECGTAMENLRRELRERASLTDELQGQLEEAVTEAAALSASIQRDSMDFAKFSEVSKNLVELEQHVQTEDGVMLLMKSELEESASEQLEIKLAHLAQLQELEEVQSKRDELHSLCADADLSSLHTSKTSHLPSSMMAAAQGAENCEAWGSVPLSDGPSDSTEQCQISELKSQLADSEAKCLKANTEATSAMRAAEGAVDHASTLGVELAVCGQAEKQALEEASEKAAEQVSELKVELTRERANHLSAAAAADVAWTTQSELRASADAAEAALSDSEELIARMEGQLALELNNRIAEADAASAQFMETSACLQSQISAEESQRQGWELQANELRTELMREHADRASGVPEAVVAELHAELSHERQTRVAEIIHAESVTTSRCKQLTEMALMEVKTELNSERHRSAQLAADRATAVAAAAAAGQHQDAEKWKAEVAELSEELANTEYALEITSEAAAEEDGEEPVGLREARRYRAECAQLEAQLHQQEQNGVSKGGRCTSAINTPEIDRSTHSSIYRTPQDPNPFGKDEGEEEEDEGSHNDGANPFGIDFNESSESEPEAGNWSSNAVRSNTAIAQGQDAFNPPPRTSDSDLQSVVSNMSFGPKRLTADFGSRRPTHEQPKLPLMPSTQEDSEDEHPIEGNPFGDDIKEATADTNPLKESAANRLHSVDNASSSTQSTSAPLSACGASLPKPDTVGATMPDQGNMLEELEELRGALQAERSARTRAVDEARAAKHALAQAHGSQGGAADVAELQAALSEQIAKSQRLGEHALRAERSRHRLLQELAEGGHAEADLTAIAKVVGRAAKAIAEFSQEVPIHNAKPLPKPASANSVAAPKSATASIPPVPKILPAPMPGRLPPRPVADASMLL